MNGAGNYPQRVAEQLVALRREGVRDFKVAWRWAMLRCPPPPGWGHERRAHSPLAFMRSQMRDAWYGVGRDMRSHAAALRLLTDDRDPGALERHTQLA